MSEFFVLCAYAIAGVSGAIGGCGAASVHLLRNERMVVTRAAYAVAYALIGAIAGVLFAAYGLLFRPEMQSVAQVVPGAMISGLSMALTLAGTNISAKWILRRLGIELELTIRNTSAKGDAQ
jgi:hypothetical protein